MPTVTLSPDPPDEVVLHVVATHGDAEPLIASLIRATAYVVRAIITGRSCPCRAASISGHRLIPHSAPSNAYGAGQDLVHGEWRFGRYLPLAWPP